jgi:hypothetical protein
VFFFYVLADFSLTVVQLLVLSLISDFGAKTPLSFAFDFQSKVYKSNSFSLSYS